MNWYYAKNGAQEGPITTEDLRAKIQAGEVAPGDLAWREGLADWMPVSTIPDLATQPAPPPAAPVSYGAPAPASAAPYQAPVAPAQVVVPVPAPSNGLAIASMVCGILCFLGCCVPVVSPILALVAIILGHMALSGRKTGKGMAGTGLVLGYLGLILGVTCTYLYISTQAKLVRETAGMNQQQREEYIESFRWLPISPEMQREMHDRQMKSKARAGQKSTPSE